ncbi:MAG: DNA polymerase III subunit delta' [Betaproteobacteria bacterium]
MLRHLTDSRVPLPHALLLYGPEGIGKARLAGSVAQALLCESATSRPCQACAACNWFEAGSHPDFRLIEPARPDADEQEEQAGPGKGGLRIVIEQVRGLADFINVSSHRGRAKVILIKPAEAMNANAANALLKNLEEPPAGTFFLLVAHRVHFLLPTLRSRCRQIALPAPRPKSATDWLRSQGATDAALALAHTGNAPVLAYELQHGDYWRQRDSFLSQVAVRRFDPLAAADQAGDIALRDVLSWLQKWTYDLALRRCAGRVRYNPDRGAEIDALSALVDPMKILRFHRDLLNLQRVIDHPLNARLLLEQVLLDYDRAVTNVATESSA